MNLILSCRSELGLLSVFLLLKEVAVEKPETQVPASAPLSTDHQVTAGAIGLITGGPLGALVGWWAIRLYKGKWVGWIITGFIVAPVLTLAQFTLLWGILKTFDYSDLGTDQALEAIENDKYKDALDMLEEHVSSHPEDPKGWYLLGLSKQKLGNFGESIDDFTKAIKLKPDYFEAYLARSESQAKIKDQ